MTRIVQNLIQNHSAYKNQKALNSAGEKQLTDDTDVRIIRPRL